MNKTLEEQRTEFANRKFLATPLSGLIAWLLVVISDFFLSNKITAWVLFIAPGSIVYLALFISKYTGENFLDKTKPKNLFNYLVLYALVKAALIYAIVIPFFIIDNTSLLLSVGILTGFLWVPFSWIIKDSVVIFHAVLRTVSIVILWFVFPDRRFVVIPICIVFIYIIAIFILNKRTKKAYYEIRNSHRK